MGITRNILLYPVSLIYAIITGFRNFLYNYGLLSTTVFPIPIICVGNITVGGTGKTPHTEYLVDLLRQNFRVATLSRGYKRETRDFRIASASSCVSEIGDEPLQIFGKFPDIMVTVDRNRVNGVRQILDIAPDTEVIILDDGFQHRSITPGLSILLTDFERPFMKDAMLPYGNLREHKSNMRRADVILITKCPKNLNPMQRRLILKEIGKAPYQNLYFTSLSYRSPLPVFGNREKDQFYFDLTKCSDSSIVLLTGIANPNPLREYLKKFFSEITELAYPDHYSYKESDISIISSAYNDLQTSAKYIMTTEKDAVRLREFNDIEESVKTAMFYVPVGITFLNEDKDEFDKLVIDYVRKNKQNSRIS
jgi:tetraacyldisaccharide 4'-kinase